MVPPEAEQGEGLPEAGGALEGGRGFVTFGTGEDGEEEAVGAPLASGTLNSLVAVLEASGVLPVSLLEPLLEGTLSKAVIDGDRDDFLFLEGSSSFLGVRWSRESDISATQKSSSHPQIKQFPSI